MNYENILNNKNFIIIPKIPKDLHSTSFKEYINGETYIESSYINHKNNENTNLVITNNVSVKINQNSFKYGGNYNLIMPINMALFRISKYDEVGGLKQYETWLLVANKNLNKFKNNNDYNIMEIDKAVLYTLSGGKIILSTDYDKTYDIENERIIPFVDALIRSQILHP